MRKAQEAKAELPSHVFSQAKLSSSSPPVSSLSSSSSLDISHQRQMMTKAASNRPRCAIRSPSLPLGSSSTRESLTTELVDVEDHTPSQTERTVATRDFVSGNPGQRSIRDHRTGMTEGPPSQCQYTTFDPSCHLSSSPTALATQTYQYPYHATAIATDSDPRYYGHRTYGSTLSRVRLDADSKCDLMSITGCRGYAGVPEPIGCSGYGLGTVDKPSSDFVSRGLTSYHAPIPGYHGSLPGYHSYIPGYQGPHSFMNIGLSTHVSTGF